MATHAQIRIVQEQPYSNVTHEPVMLYRHFNGYPKDIIPDIKTAYKIPREKIRDALGNLVLVSDYNRVMARKVASLIVGANPTQYEVVEDKAWVTDFFYCLYVSPGEDGRGEKARWELEIFDGFETDKLHEVRSIGFSALKDIKPILPRKNIWEIQKKDLERLMK